MISVLFRWGGGLRKKQLVHTYEDIISLDNFLLAWQEFIIGKKNKIDVQEFAYDLMDNIVSLHEDLKNHAYQHGGYTHFVINDPKRRDIHKASVRDRLLHHAVYRILYPFFDHTFIADSYSCRVDKGVHRVLNRFREYAYAVSRNHTRTCWILKCDIRKFFANIDHEVLFAILNKYIPDQEIMRLLKNVVKSFPDGLPLGNLTSQLLTNIYMNVFDQWVKQTLKARCYIRYADDFVFFSADKDWLENIVPRLQAFLQKELKLSLHPNKLFLRTAASGVDYLGWVHFPDHRVLRKATRRRMFARVREHPSEEAVQSYLGMLSHGNAEKIKRDVMTEYWLCQ